ncbi:dTMP kinase [Lutibaculum baratangense]|uniref:Thymidylate kinase n=1 Tax=Lutibaculum baratangense AMV1 TaxID=631454 RepID=V4QRW9_9HYPH|nr:dTMP kinase [Lutibaculum baratangense]ESR22487.1 Thymidylate kinase [Lutibaculum baratangense AMV1]
MARGRFITFEGGEGTGKSTQLRRLAARLRGLGIEVLETREPGGTQGAELIRHAVLSGRVSEYGAFAEALLMNVARDDHLRHVILPALEEGRWVLSDRFHDSTRAYQGASCTVDEGLLQAMEEIVLSDTRPDLTVVLDLDVETGLGRARKQTKAEAKFLRDRFEDADLDYHRRVREVFLARARAEPERCVVVAADGDADEVAELVWRAVASRLGLKERSGTDDG